MSRHKRNFLGLVIATVLLTGCLVALFIWRTRVVVEDTYKQMLRHPEMASYPCIRVFEDRNGDGRLDPNDQWLDDLPGTEIEVLDAEGYDSGRFPLAECYIRPQAQHRTIHVMVTLPAGYLATTSLEHEVSVQEATYFHDYPPRIYIGVRKN
jgi:hypothetical protein